MGQIIFIGLTISTFVFFGYTCFSILSYFKLTKRNTYPVFNKINERVYLTLLVAFGQSTILRKPFAGLLHAIVYWGFLVITIGTVEMIIDGFTGTNRILGSLGGIYSIITTSGEIFAVAVIFSCIIFLGRRYITKPRRFNAVEMKPASKIDATVILSMILLLMLSLLGMNIGYVLQGGTLGSFPVSNLLASGFTSYNIHTFEMINWWIHISLVYLFLNILPYSKHFHVILAVPNVFLDRIEPKGKLNTMESVTREVKLMMDPNAAFSSESSEPMPTPPGRFGVKDVEDITWKTLMDAYTCTECGRCTEVCPANITGKLLSPRKLFIDARARMKEKGKGLLKEGKEFSDGKSLVGNYITAEELWACTTCGACMQECPVNINHVPFIIDMRRNLVMEESKAPTQLNQMFMNIENNGAPWQFSPSERFNWAQELYMPLNKF